MMLWRGISIEPEWVVLALLVIAIALGRGKTFIADWAPFLLLFFAYEAMRGFAAKTGFAPHDLSGLERAVFGGTLPTLTLQHAFYRVETVSPQDVVAMFFYFMHFPMPILVGFVFWLRSRDHYHRFIAAQFQEGQVASSQVVHKILNETVDKFWGSNYIVTPLYTHLNPNQFAAFPSLHAAFPALAAVYAWNRFRLLAIGLFVWTAAVMLSIVYLGEHYVVDALDGFLYVAVATALVEGFVKWRGRRTGVMPARPSA
ncbi:MAG: phosphatase PAP2 family protein [Chloroflexi bacterium]|nr:MAG: phosphatase PAP2 family protein [Chloroflexota bacterium]